MIYIVTDFLSRKPKPLIPWRDVVSIKARFPVVLSVCYYSQSTLSHATPLSGFVEHATVVDGPGFLEMVNTEKQQEKK